VQALWRTDPPSRGSYHIYQGFVNVFLIVTRDTRYSWRLDAVWLVQTFVENPLPPSWLYKLVHEPGIYSCNVPPSFGKLKDKIFADLIPVPILKLFKRIIILLRMQKALAPSSTEPEKISLKRYVYVCTQIFFPFPCGKICHIFTAVRTWDLR
jgi:hypothetical protein